MSYIEAKQRKSLPPLELQLHPRLMCFGVFAEVVEAMNQR